MYMLLFSLALGSQCAKFLLEKALKKNFDDAYTIFVKLMNIHDCKISKVWFMSPWQHMQLTDFETNTFLELSKV